VWATRFGRGRLATRALDYLTFYASAAAAMARLAGEGTVLVAETDPPLVSVPAALIAWWRRAWLVNWTQDLFPEIAQALHVPGVPLVAPLLRRLRNRSLARAAANVVLGEDMGARLRAQGIAADKIVVIPNWSLPETEAAAAPDAVAALRAEWNLADKLVVGYSGNFGRVPDLGTVLDAAAALRGEPRIHFLFIGDGAQRSFVEARVATLGLDNVSLRPYQPRERLATSLAVPDLHLVSQKPEVAGLVVPSKLYAVLAAERPCCSSAIPGASWPRRSSPLAAVAPSPSAITSGSPRPCAKLRHGPRWSARWAAVRASCGRRATSAHTPSRPGAGCWAHLS
jgi:colanic acid biosynthesis glycosyl transferase WcaI